jgi:hypothetical protein
MTRPTPMERYKALRFIYKMNQAHGTQADVDSLPVGVADSLPANEWESLLAFDRLLGERHLRLRLAVLNARMKAGLAGSPTREVLLWIASDYTHRLPAWQR